MHNIFMHTRNTRKPPYRTKLTLLTTHVQRTMHKTNITTTVVVAPLSSLRTSQQYIPNMNMHKRMSYLQPSARRCHHGCHTKIIHTFVRARSQVPQAIGIARNSVSSLGKSKPSPTYFPVATTTLAVSRFPAG